MRVSVIGQEDLNQRPRSRLGLSEQNRHAHEERHDAEEVREGAVPLMTVGRRKSSRAIEYRPEKVRLVVPVSSTRAVIVSDDPVLIDQEDYAPGVMRSLRKAWRDDDFFVVSVVDAKGEILDSVSGMAGYGGPLKAARAAISNYFSNV
jgi:hypothetical protein